MKKSFEQLEAGINSNKPTFEQLEEKVSGVTDVVPDTAVTKTEVESVEQNARDLLKFSDKLSLPPSIADKIIGSLTNIERKKPIGFKEGILQDAFFKIPIVGTVGEGIAMLDLKVNAARLNDPDFDWNALADETNDNLSRETNFKGGMGGAMRPSKEEFKPVTGEQLRSEAEKTINAYIENLADRAERGYTFGGKVGQGLSVLPAWMIDMAITGGTYNKANAVTKRFLSKQIKNNIVKSTAGWVVGSGTATAVLPQRILSNSMRRSLLNDEGWATSVVKGYLDTWVEVGSERSGEAISKGIGWGVNSSIGRMPFASKLMTKIQDAWIKLAPENTVAKFSKKMLSKAGYDGIIGELGEERLATILHGLTKTDTFGLADNSTVVERVLAGLKQDMELENIGSEIVVLSVPGGAKVTLGAVADIADKALLRRSIEKHANVSKEVANKAVKILEKDGAKEAENYLSTVISENEKVADKEFFEEEPVPDITEEEIVQDKLSEIGISRDILTNYIKDIKNKQKDTESSKTIKDKLGAKFHPWEIEDLEDSIRDDVESGLYNDEDLPEVVASIIEGNLNLLEKDEKRKDFEKRYTEAAKIAGQNEKTPGRQMSPEEVDLANKDWKAYSRSRGYTEDEIKQYEEFLNLYKEGIELGYSSGELAEMDLMVNSGYAVEMGEDKYQLSPDEYDQLFSSDNVEVEEDDNTDNVEDVSNKPEEQAKAYLLTQGFLPDQFENRKPGELEKLAKSYGWVPEGGLTEEDKEEIDNEEAVEEWSMSFLDVLSLVIRNDLKDAQSGKPRLTGSDKIELNADNYEDELEDRGWNAEDISDFGRYIELIEEGLSLGQSEEMMTEIEDSEEERILDSGSLGFESMYDETDEQDDNYDEYEDEYDEYDSDDEQDDTGDEDDNDEPKYDRRRGGFVQIPPVTTAGKIADENPNIRVVNLRKDIGELQRWLLTLGNQSKNSGVPIISLAGDILIDSGLQLNNEIRAEVSNGGHVYKTLPKEYRKNKGEKFFNLMDEYSSPEDIKKSDLPQSVKDALIFFRKEEESMRLAVIEQKRLFAISVLRTKSNSEIFDMLKDNRYELRDSTVAGKPVKRIFDTKANDFVSKESLLPVLAKREVPDSWGRQWAHIHHAFFGQWSLTWKETDPDTGETISHVIGRAETQTEAYIKLRDWKEAQRANGRADVDEIDLVATPEIMIPYDMLRLGRKHFFALEKQLKEAADIESQAVSDGLRGIIGKKESKQKFTSSLLYRKGVQGYSKDFMRVWEAEVTQFYRWKYLTDMNRKVEPLIERIKGLGLPGWAQYLEDTKQYLWGAQRSQLARNIDTMLNNIPIIKNFTKPFALERWIGMLKTISYHTKLQTLKFAFVNKLQLAQTLWPVVGERQFYRGVKLYFSKEGQELLRKYHVSGTSGKLHEMGMGRTRSYEKFTPAGFSEAGNQGLAFVTLYDYGKRQGMDDETAARYARLRGQVFTQFANTAADTPMIMRNPVGGLIFQYKRFTIKNLELVSRLLREGNYTGVARWALANTLIGGTSSILNVVTSLPMGGWLAYKLYKKLEEEYGKEAADFIHYGIPGLIGIDLGGSVSPIDVPYGDTLPEKIGNATLGPTGVTALKIITDMSRKDLANEPGKLRRGLQSFINSSPSIKQIEYLAKALDKDTSNYDARQRLQYELDTWDLWKKAFGFRPTDESDQRLVFEAYMQIKEEYTSTVSEIALRILEGNTQAAEKEIKEWNSMFPEIPISSSSITNSIKSKVLQREVPLTKRMFMEMPENMRAPFIDIYNELEGEQNED